MAEDNKDDDNSHKTPDSHHHQHHHHGVHDSDSSCAYEEVMNYLDWYRDAKNDPFHGSYRGVMELFRSVSMNGSPILSAEEIMSRIILSDSRIPQAFVMLILDPDVGAPRTYLLHRLTRFPSPFGTPSTPWDNRMFGVIGDHAQGQQLVVEWPGDDAFRVTQPTMVPLLDSVEPQLANLGPGAGLAELLGPFPGGEGTSRTDIQFELISTRPAMYVPPRYVPLLLRERLSPRSAWCKLGRAILMDGKQDECAPLLDWLRVAMTASLQTQEGGLISAVTIQPPTSPLMDLDLMQHRRRLLETDLPTLRHSAESCPHDPSKRQAPASGESGHQYHPQGSIDTFAAALAALRTTTNHPNSDAEPSSFKHKRRHHKTDNKRKNDEKSEEAPVPQEPKHELPPYCGKWSKTNWTAVNKTKYLQQACRCGRRVRTYCKCDEGQILCNDCYTDHYIKVHQQQPT